jgi:hypothetical protein
MVTYHRIRSVAIISAIAVAMLALLSGPAHAIPQRVILTSPGGTVPPAYNSGDTVAIEGTIEADSGDIIDLSVTIGTATLSFDDIAIGPTGAAAFSGLLTLASDEPDGLKDVGIVASLSSDPTVALRLSMVGRLIVDDTAPEFIGLSMTWDPTRELSTPTRLFTNAASPTLTLTVQDPAGLGVLPSGFYEPATLTMSVFRENDGGALSDLVPGSAATVLRPPDRTEPWQIVWTPDGPLEDGSYFVMSSVTDAAGNANETTEYSFYIDTTPPEIGGDAWVDGVAQNATNGRWFTRNRNVTASWAASEDPLAPDLSQGSGLLGYSFQVWTKAGDTPTPAGTILYDGHTDVDSWEGTLAYISPTGTDTEAWSTGVPMPFESGEAYGVWLRAWDMLHNASDWFDPPFVFDPDAPTPPLAPDVIGLMNPATDRRIADSTPTLLWAHSSDAAPVAQSGVDLYELQVTRAGTWLWDVMDVTIDLPDEDVDGEGGDDAPLTGTFSWTVPDPLVDGEYVVRVRAKDVAGNYSDWAIVPALQIDTTPPPVPGMPSTESPTGNQNPIWTWTSGGGGGDGDVARYGVYEDGLSKGTVLAATFTSTGLSEGVHVLEVTAIDDLGNESSRSTPGHVLIDLTAPAVPVMLAPAPFTNATTLALSWTSVEGAVSYELETSIHGVTTTTTGIETPVFMLDITAATEANVVTARVRAYDSVGNVSAWSAQVSTIVDRTGPVTMVVAAPPHCTNDTRPTWEWIGCDAGLSGVAFYTVALDDEAAFPTTDTSFTPVSDLPAGCHRLTVVAVDALGNVGEPLVFPVVVIFEPVVIDVNPLPGTYPVNHVSTIVITLTGMVDADLKVAVGSLWLEDWRIVEISRTLGSSKFYVLLDEDVLVPGRLVLTVDAGMTRDKFLYDVLNERSGFGFGRLRPW